MMNIQKEILRNMKSGNKLIEIICQIVEGSDEIDYADIADAIKDNPTMLKLLEEEFKKLNMIPKNKDEINLTNIFKEL